MEFSLETLSTTVNDERTMKRDARSYFSPFVDQSSPDLISMSKRDCSLQCRFPFDDILFHFGDIRDQLDQVAKLS